MNSVWQQFTLSDLPLYRWRGASYLYRLVGLLQQWRQGSLLMQWGDIIGALLGSVILGLAPFVSNDLVGVLLVASAGYWALLTISDDKKAGATPIHLLVLAYWGISIVATALSPVKVAALTGLIKLTLYLVLFALLARVLRSPRIRSWFIALYLHVAVIVSVYGLRQWFFGAAQLATWVDTRSSLANTTRVYSFLGNPNLLAGYLLPAIALSLAAIFAWRGWMPKALALTMFVVNSACLVLTFSRGGWIGLVLLLGVFLVLLLYILSVSLPPFWRTWSIPLLLGGLVGVLFLAVVFVEPVRDRVSSIFAGRGDSSNNFRINVWAAILNMIRDRPLFGIGPGNSAFNRVYPLYQISPKYTALSAYSILLEIIVETGFLGFLCFVWLMVVAFNEGIRQLARLRTVAESQRFWLMGAIAGMVGLLGQGFFDTVWYRPEVNTLWWFMVALVASFYISPEKHARKQLLP